MKRCTAAILTWMALLGPALALADDQPKAKPEGQKKAGQLPTSPSDVFAELYEHLADSIIEIRATEDNLVKGLLVNYHAAAQRHLGQAGRGNERVMHLEAAATEITNIANEGDKRVQAVRQRLKEAGHYHQEDAETQEDYMFIDSKEKKELIALAQKVGRMGEDAAPADLKAVANELRNVFTKAIGRE